MRTLILTIEDGREESLKKILNEIPYVVAVTDQKKASLAEESSQYERIKKILDAAKGKDLFKEIENPLQWQRQIRTEWELIN